MARIRPSALLLISTLTLSAALVFYPLRPSPHHAPIESLDAIPHMAVLTFLVVTWIASIILLICFSPSRPSAIFVTLLFALVYFGFWTIHLPYGRFEDWTNMQTVGAIVSYGRIEEVAHYWLWPATGLVGAISSQVAGIEIVDLRLSLVLWFQITLALVMLVAFFWLLRDDPVEWAVLAVFVAIVSNELLARFHFFPRNFAHVLLIAASVVVLRATLTREQDARASVVLLVVLTMALAATHLVTSVLLFFMVVGSHIVMRGNGSSILRGPRGRSMLVFCGVVPWAWQLYWAVPVLERVVDVVRQVVGSVREQGILFFYSYFLDVARINTAEAPAWASIVRLFWLALVYVIGTLIALTYLAKLGRIAFRFRLAAIWVVSVGLVTIAGMVLVPGGEQLERYIYFGSYFLSPILLGVAVRSLGKRPAVLLTACVLTSLAVPTLLVNGNLVGTFSYYPQQRAAGLFLQLSVLPEIERRASVSVFGVGPGWSVAAYHSIGASVKAQPWPDETTENREEYVRSGLAKFADAFGRQRRTGSVVVLWDDVLAPEYLRHWFGQLGTRHVLGPIQASLERGDVVYENGFARLSLSE